MKVPCTTKFAKTKKAASSTSTQLSGNTLPVSVDVKTEVAIPPKVSTCDENVPTIPAVLSQICGMDVSPSKSDGNSVSMDESMSACDSFKSPDVEYIDNNDIPAIDSINRSTFRNLHISDDSETTGDICESCNMCWQ